MFTSRVELLEDFLMPMCEGPFCDVSSSKDSWLFDCSLKNFTMLEVDANSRGLLHAGFGPCSSLRSVLELNSAVESS